MPAIISIGERIKRAFDFKALPIFIGLSGVTPWVDESTPPEFDETMGLDNEYSFFDECFAIRKVSEFKHLMIDVNTYSDPVQAAGYLFYPALISGTWAEGDIVEEVGDTSGKTGVLRKILTGADKIGVTDEFAIDQVIGVFSPGAVIRNAGSLGTAVVLRAGEKRFLYRDNMWRESHDTDVALHIIGSIAQLSVGGVVEDVSDAQITGRILAIKTITVGANVHNFVVVQPLANAFTNTSSIKPVGVATTYPVAEKLHKAYVESAFYLYFKVDFTTTSIPEDVTYRKVGVIIDPKTGSSSLTGNQYDERSDGGISGWGTNDWYINKFVGSLGRIQFLENRKPIARAVDQSETLKVVVRF